MCVCVFVCVYSEPEKWNGKSLEKVIVQMHARASPPTLRAQHNTLLLLLLLLQCPLNATCVWLTCTTFWHCATLYGIHADRVSSVCGDERNTHFAVFVLTAIPHTGPPTDSIHFCCDVLRPHRSDGVFKVTPCGFRVSSVRVTTEHVQGSAVFMCIGVNLI